MVESHADEVFPRANYRATWSPNLQWNRWSSSIGQTEPEEPNSVRRCEVSGWYGLLVSALKVIGVFAAVAAAARGFVAFGAWRTSLRNRLIGIEPHRQETS